MRASGLWILISAAVGISLGVLAYWIALLVSPTLTKEGHRVMPIGHIAVAFICAGVGATMAFAIGLRRSRKKKRVEGARPLT